MKKPSYLLKIENPCGEDWAQMKPEAQGRFCSHCSKTVVNFAEMTDNQILKIIEREQGRVCGRFHNDQLNRPMAETKQQNTGGAVQKILAAMLAVSAANYAAAQTPETKKEVVVVVDSARKWDENVIVDTIITRKALKIEPICNIPTFMGGLEIQLYNSENIVEGQVIDTTGNPVPFVNIQIKRTKIKMTSDVDGRFKLNISDKLLKRHHVLVVTSAGYEPAETILPKKSKLERLKIILKPVYLTGLTSVIITKDND